MESKILNGGPSQGTLENQASLLKNGETTETYLLFFPDNKKHPGNDHYSVEVTKIELVRDSQNMWQIEGTLTATVAVAIIWSTKHNRGEMWAKNIPCKPKPKPWDFF